MTSLTREALLALKPAPKEIEVEGLGKVFIKPLTELLRARRLSEMYDEKSKINKSAFEKRRANQIIDQVCDEKGDPLFSQDDLRNILELDASSLDSLCNKIDEINESLEKKD
jgi:hypothetical protein